MQGCTVGASVVGRSEAGRAKGEGASRLLGLRVAAGMPACLSQPCSLPASQPARHGFAGEWKLLQLQRKQHLAERRRQLPEPCCCMRMHFCRPIYLPLAHARAPIWPPCNSAGTEDQDPFRGKQVTALLERMEHSIVHCSKYCLYHT